uniref:Delta(3,5)-Delta(2,4)-dienoyl-CoA isomerase, mitochondrial n=1 Tax=Amblyomma cajennense TaxID=34607 RepID=A0A023FI95_AMBCJ
MIFRRSLQLAGRALLVTSKDLGIRCMSRSMSSQAATGYSFETLLVTQPAEHVFQIELNRPDKLNAMNVAFWMELPKCMQQLHDDRNCRVVVVSGAGRMFTAGLDLASMANTFTTESPDGEELDVARKARRMHALITSYQQTFTSLEKCNKPVIAAVHNGCIGGGVDMVTACDIRYCTTDAYFQVKEVDLGLAADVGTLQRLPRVIGNASLVNELVFTARKMEAPEAFQAGLVSRVFPDKGQMMAAALDVAKQIASKSPVAVQGSKVHLVYSRDHSVEEGLNYMAAWNMCMLQSEDLMKSAMAMMAKEKEPPKFSNL